MDSCSTPASAAAMHANPTPRTTRVTHTARATVRASTVGGVLVALHSAFMLFACPQRRPVRTAPLSAHCNGLRGQAAGERDRRQRRAQTVAPYTLTPTPVLLPRTGLQSRDIDGGTPNEAVGSAPGVDGACDRRLSAPQ
eukprot:3155273-Pleurochrysis_carterae.AAC.1